VQLQDKVRPTRSDYLGKVIDCAIKIRKIMDLQERGKKVACARYKK
jgi:hypothetical protein